MTDTHETTRSAKRALITGIAGQDGVYLSRRLLTLGYCVFGLERRADVSARARLIERIDHEAANDCVELMLGDLADSGSLISALEAARPSEIYNLAAQSHVGASFRIPEHTANINGIGPLRLLEAVHVLGLAKEVRVVQASTADLFGPTDKAVVDETHPLAPNNPYGTAKLLGHWFTINSREANGVHASNAILFNHESPLRPDSFVTRKITKAVARIANGDPTPLALGNLDASRDWSHAKDIVDGLHRMAQQPTPDDYILASGVRHSVRDFVEMAFRTVERNIQWRGEGTDEHGVDAKTGDTLVRIDASLFRPTASRGAAGDASKARRALGWRPSASLNDLVSEMVRHDLKTLETEGTWRAD